MWSKITRNKMNLSPQNKSFLILFIIAVAGTYILVNVAKDISHGPSGSGYTQYNYQNQNNKSDIVASASDRYMPPVQSIDVSNWNTYTNAQYSLTFKYKPGWSVKPAGSQNGFYIVDVKPGSGYYNIRIYISKDGYYAIDGLPYTQTQINGYNALDVSHLLYGFKSGQYYYTFDNGLSTKLIDDFNALVHSVKF